MSKETLTTLSKTDIKVIKTCLILRKKELLKRNGSTDEVRIWQINAALEKLNEQI